MSWLSLRTPTTPPTLPGDETMPNELTRSRLDSTEYPTMPPAANNPSVGEPVASTDPLNSTSWIKLSTCANPTTPPMNTPSGSHADEQLTDTRPVTKTFWIVLPSASPVSAPTAPGPTTETEAPIR